MCNPIVSIILPVYNAEKYLQKCLDSILNQTYTHFELLLINDGSKDSSPQICDEYASRDNRIRVFHQENAGVSAARNKGLDNASGEYVTFIDADDFINVDYIEVHILNMLARGVDLVVSGLNRCYENGESEKRYNKHSQEIESKFYIEQIYLQKKGFYVIGPFSKLFRRSVIEQNQIRFNIKLVYGEDFLFLVEYMQYCNKVYDCSYVGYNYVLSSVSVVNSKSRKNENFKWKLYRSDIISQKLSGIIVEQTHPKLHYIIGSKVYLVYCDALKNLLHSINYSTYSRIERVMRCRARKLFLKHYILRGNIFSKNFLVDFVILFFPDIYKSIKSKKERG